MRLILGLAFILVTSLGSAKTDSECLPFQVYLNAQLPHPDLKTLAEVQKLNADQVLKEIFRLEGLSSHFQRLKKMKSEISLQALRCSLAYVKLDQDQDGIQDWSTFVDQKYSRVLYPRDSDWDNDGVLNPEDPDPLSTSITQNQFPHHLRADNVTTRHWQLKIWQDYRIFAINHTARHSPYLLREFYYLLKNAFKNTHWLGKVRYLYAFQKHDADHDIAAYHHSIGAISVAGESAYTESAMNYKKQELISTLAHELGHAFLMENISVSDFQKLSSDSGWRPAFKNSHALSFYDPQFFQSHQQPHMLISKYAAENAHEWFAESFANFVLTRLGIKKVDQFPTFSAWLNRKLN